MLCYVPGTYGRLTITFEFNRRINFYLLSWYLPATLIVALSWVGFWIDTKATPARISLGTITILASGSFLIGEQDGFPSVSYIRAIDIYLITCFVFVFGCMVEYAIVHYAKRLMENREKHKKTDTEAVSDLTLDIFSIHVGNGIEGFGKLFRQPEKILGWRGGLLVASHPGEVTILLATSCYRN